MDTGIRISFNQFHDARGTSKTRGTGFINPRHVHSFSLAAIFQAEIDTVIENRVKYLGNTVIDLLQSVTPVDTGMARANWQVSVARTSTARGRTRKIIYLKYYNRKKLHHQARYGLKEGVRLPLPPRSETGQDRLDNFSVAHGDRAIIITNNLPYIRRLNEGYSKKAPAGFVDMAVELAITEARQL